MSEHFLAPITLVLAGDRDPLYSHHVLECCPVFPDTDPAPTIDKVKYQIGDQMRNGSPSGSVWTLDAAEGNPWVADEWIDDSHYLDCYDSSGTYLATYPITDNDANTATVTGTINASTAQAWIRPTKIYLENTTGFAASGAAFLPGSTVLETGNGTWDAGQSRLEDDQKTSTNKNDWAADKWNGAILFDYSGNVFVIADTEYDAGELKSWITVVSGTPASGPYLIVSATGYITYTSLFDAGGEVGLAGVASIQANHYAGETVCQTPVLVDKKSSDTHTYWWVGRGEKIYLRKKLVDKYGNHSPWSGDLVDQAAGDTTPPPNPTLPTDVAVAGSASVISAELKPSYIMPADVKRLEWYRNTSSTFPTTGDYVKPFDTGMSRKVSLEAAYDGTTTWYIFLKIIDSSENVNTAYETSVGNTQITEGGGSAGTVEISLELDEPWVEKNKSPATTLRIRTSENTTAGNITVTSSDNAKVTPGTVSGSGQSFTCPINTTATAVVADYLLTVEVTADSKRTGLARIPIRVQIDDSGGSSIDKDNAAFDVYAAGKLRYRSGKLETGVYGIRGWDAETPQNVIFELSNSARKIGGWDFTSPNQLSADSGNFKLNASIPYLALGAATDYMTGIGIWMGKHAGVYKEHHGNPAGNHWYWDNATLYVNGVIAGSMSIGATSATTFTINSARADTTVSLILGRTTGGDATFSWDGSLVRLDKNMRVNGNLGIGTTPSELVHLLSSAAGGDPTLRIDGWNNATYSSTGAIEFWENNYFNQLHIRIESLRGGSANIAYLRVKAASGTGTWVYPFVTGYFGTVINDEGVDLDFRVEAVGRANALLVQGSNGFVGIGMTPVYTLDVTGSIRASTDIRLAVADANNAYVHISASGTGAAAIYMDASNGDFAGSDYIRIGQNEDLSLTITNYKTTSYIALTTGTLTTLKVFQGLVRVEAVAAVYGPATGEGVEMYFLNDGGSNDYGLLQSYDRAAATYRELKIYADPIVMRGLGGAIFHQAGNGQALYCYYYADRGDVVGDRWRTATGTSSSHDFQFYGTGAWVTHLALSATDMTLAPPGDIILNPTGNDVLPNSNYDINLGSLTRKYLTLHAAELWVETLVAQEVMATIGGRIVVSPTTELTSDLSDSATTIYVKHNNLVNGDRIWLESSGKFEMMAVTSAPSGTGPYSYTVTRNLDGSGATAWYAGDGVVNTKTTGYGFMDLYSVSGVKTRVDGGTSTQYGPTIVGNVRYGTGAMEWAEHWAIGNLQGLYGYGDFYTYGVGFGGYVNNSSFITIDATNGYRIQHRTGGANTVLGQWDTSGNIIIGEVATGKSNISISPSEIWLRNNTTTRLLLDTAGNIRVGEIGTGKSNIYISSTEVLLRNNTTVKIKLDTSGNILVGQTGTSQSNVYITSGAVKLRNNTTDMIILNADGSAMIATFNFSPTTGFYTGTGATRIQLLAGTGIWLGATAFGDAPFRVSPAGALTASSANITGTITATGGAIAGWIIAAGYIGKETIPGPSTTNDCHLKMDSGGSSIFYYDPSPANSQAHWIGFGQLHNGTDWTGDYGIAAVYKNAAGSYETLFEVSNNAVQMAAFTIAANSLTSTLIGIHSAGYAEGAEILLGHATAYASAKIGFKADGSGKLASGSISWTAPGVVTMSGNFTSSATITGGTLQTAASGQRIVMQGGATNDIKCYDAVGLKIEIGKVVTPSGGVFGIEMPNADLNVGHIWANDVEAVGWLEVGETINAVGTVSSTTGLGTLGTIIAGGKITGSSDLEINGNLIDLDSSGHATIRIDRGASATYDCMLDFKSLGTTAWRVGQIATSQNFYWRKDGTNTVMYLLYGDAGTEGTLYIDGTYETFCDYYAGDALSLIEKIRGKGRHKGNSLFDLDHSTVPRFLTSEVDWNGKPRTSMSLNGMVDLHTRAIQQIDISTKNHEIEINQLRNRVAYLEGRVSQLTAAA